MTSAGHSGGMGWGARLMIALALILAGAALAAWGLARYEGAARLFGIGPDEREIAVQRIADEQSSQPSSRDSEQISEREPTAESAQRIADLEARLRQVETAAQRVEGSAGRADALLVAFAARRAIDRGVALGYLEPVILDRFGETHAKAVATIVTGSHSPVRLSDLVADYRELGPQLRAPGPDEGLWEGFKRELGSLIQVRRSDRPNPLPDARYNRALDHLQDGEVDAALAETMRLPGASRAEDWIRRAREYVAIRNALDEIESAALMGRTRRASP